MTPEQVVALKESKKLKSRVALKLLKQDLMSNNAQVLQYLWSQTLRDDTGQHFDEFHRLTNRYFEAIAMLLMPLDRRSSVVAHQP